MGFLYAEILVAEARFLAQYSAPVAALEYAAMVRNHYMGYLSPAAAATQREAKQWHSELIRARADHIARIMYRPPARHNTYIGTRTMKIVAQPACCDRPLVDNACQNSDCPNVAVKCSLCRKSGLRYQHREGLCGECHAIKSCADDWASLKIELLTGKSCFECCKPIVGGAVKQGKKYYHRACDRNGRKMAPAAVVARETNR